MTLDDIDRWRLYEAGFTAKEISELSGAVTPTGAPQPLIDLNSPAWQSTLTTRRNFTNQLRATYYRVHRKELTRIVHDKIVNQWYKKGLKKSPFDWLKISYQPRIKTDFIAAAKKRIKKQQYNLKRNFGVAR